MAEERTIQIQDDSGNIYYPQTKAAAVFSANGKSVESYLADFTTYSIVKSNLDSNGIYTTIQHKRKDGTLILNSVLSDGTSPQYTTRTETYYKADGTTVDKAATYTIAYDANGMVASEVLQ